MRQVTAAATGKIRHLPSETDTRIAPTGVKLKSLKHKARATRHRRKPGCATLPKSVTNQDD